MPATEIFNILKTSRALAEEPSLTLADVAAMSDADCRRHLTSCRR
jgi:hypothetical protein